jgi:hypothetical protein
MSKEGIISIFQNRKSAAKPSFEILRFDIHYSAVRFLTGYLYHPILEPSRDAVKLQITTDIKNETYYIF